MSESDNNLKNALAENGVFDPERAKELRGGAVATFRSRMKWVERTAFIFLDLALGLGLFAYFKFMGSTDTRALVGYGILLLIAFENTVLIKLWYWIMNNKIGVLKEIKLLRLEASAARAEDRPTHAAEAGDTVFGRLRGLSRWERIAWKLSIFVVIIPLAIFMSLDANATLSSEGYLTVAADGSGTEVRSVSYVSHDVMPKTSFDLYGEMPASGVRWLDDRGRELSFAVSRKGGQKCCTIDLIEPVMPGERLAYRSIAESPARAAKEGDVWTCRTDWTYGCAINKYRDTVMLPRGAEIVSVSPDPSRQFVRGGKPVLKFKARKGPGGIFEYTVRYRLPLETKTSAKDAAD